MKSERVIIDIIKAFINLENEIRNIECNIENSDFMDLGIWESGIIKKCMKELKFTIDDEYYNTTWEAIGCEEDLGEWFKMNNGEENTWPEQKKRIRELAKKKYGDFDYEKLRDVAWDELEEEYCAKEETKQ